MLVKIDHTVMSLLREDRADLVDQLKNSKRMYSWVDGEDVGETIDRFALANPTATIGDFIEWTKRTYPERLRAIREGGKFEAYELEGDYNPTRSRENSVRFGKHGEAAKGVSIVDAIPARLKVKDTGPKKVAEPGQEAEVDKADADALAQETGDNPATPPSDLTELKPVEPGQKSETPPPAKPGLGLKK